MDKRMKKRIKKNRKKCSLLIITITKKLRLNKIKINGRSKKKLINQIAVMVYLKNLMMVI